MHSKNTLRCLGTVCLLAAVSSSLDQSWCCKDKGFHLLRTFISRKLEIRIAIRSSINSWGLAFKSIRKYSHVRQTVSLEHWNKEYCYAKSKNQIEWNCIGLNSADFSIHHQTFSFCRMHWEKHHDMTGRTSPLGKRHRAWVPALLGGCWGIL